MPKDGRSSVVMLTLGACLWVSDIGAQVQQPSNPRVSFEVASVRRNVSATVASFRAEGFPRPGPGGRFDAQNITVRTLLRYAYAMRPYQRIEGNQRLLDERFDIRATAPGEVPRVGEFELGAMNLMVQTLLVDRFNIAVRWEERDDQVYLLERVQAEGERLGPNLSPSEDCSALKDSGERSACRRPSVDGRLRNRGALLSELTLTLSQLVGLPVIDRTGLKGHFEYGLTFTSAGLTGPGAVPNSPFENAPSLFTALREQLGLKLERSRMGVSTLIVERAGPFVEN
jgi:uncharacterized protein (TIGR03435 family)